MRTTVRLALGPMACVACAAGLGGCYLGGYAGTSRWVGLRAESGCLDVALAMTDDARAPSPIIAYTFGNRCAHQTVVDFTAPRVVGIQTDGTRVPLQPADPKHELRPMQIDALTDGQERIAYVAGGAVTNPPLQLVCVDLAKLDAHDDASHADWKCLAAYSTESIQ